MDCTSLDSLIDQLEGLIRDRTGLLPSLHDEFITTPTEIVGFLRHDWRPVWAKAKEIQEGFNAKVRYPTKELQEQAWTRFNSLRNAASAANNAEREKFQRMSEYYRNEILSLAQSARYSKVLDAVFFFDPTTVEEMKKKATTLHEAGQMLSANKAKMHREHKDECFAAIQEARRTHDDFWGQYKEARAERAQRHQERRAEIVAKTEGNIDANKERLSKAQAALAKAEAHISDLEDKIAGTRSEEWEERFRQWLSEAEERRDSIIESIQKIEEWIEQDEARLDDIANRSRRR
jgi:hypothetical protein